MDECFLGALDLAFISFRIRRKAPEPSKGKTSKKFACEGLPTKIGCIRFPQKSFRGPSSNMTKMTCVLVCFAACLASFFSLFGCCCCCCYRCQGGCSGRVCGCYCCCRCDVCCWSHHQTCCLYWAALSQTSRFRHVVKCLYDGITDAIKKPGSNTVRRFLKHLVLLGHCSVLQSCGRDNVLGLVLLVALSGQKKQTTLEDRDQWVSWIPVPNTEKREGPHQKK